MSFEENGLTPGATPRSSTGTDGPGVRFSASDSLTFRLRGGREARLYGNAKVDHDAGELTAGRVTLNLDEKLMSATTLTPGDTLSEPVLMRQEDRIRSERILFNYETEKGKFDVARITMDEANVTGNQVKRYAPHVIFIEDGRYSTCDLDHPHYYIRAARMKVVDEDEIFFTRARLYILDIPYPIVFPFGLVPSQIRQEQSGLLEPTYVFQDQNQRGLGLQNLGWFQYFNDYITSTLRGDIFTSGTFLVDTRTQYNYQGIYRGSVNLSYSLDRGLEPTDPDFLETSQQMVQIQHQQAISPYASFNTDLTFRTSQFYNRNSYDINDRANTSTTSRISYNYRHPDGIYTFGTNITQTQNFRDNSVSVQGPTANFSLRRQTPFQPETRNPNPSWYESISFGYNNRFNSRYNFRPLADTETDISWIDALFNASQHREATGDEGHIYFGFIQSADATAQLIPSDFANLTASIRFNEYWYPQTIRRELDVEQNRLVDRYERGFASARDFNTSLALGTTLYGISNASFRTLEGFRHTMRPSVSYNYRPDFSRDFWGYYRTVPSDTLGNTQTYSIFQRGVFGGPTAGEQQAIGFSIDNVFETKQVKRDSTGERNEQIIRIIDNLRANLSYNFAAEQFHLSPLNASMNSSVLPGINFNANATFNFYDTDSLGNAIPQFLWDNGNGYIRMTNLRLSASTQFRSGQRGAQAGPIPYYPRQYDPFDQRDFRAYDELFNSAPVQPLDVSWAFSLSFSYSWQKVGNNVNRTAVLNANNIQFRLTPEWQMSTSLGYDFIRKDLTPSRFSVTRNLHCWDMSFDWNPFGDFQYYMFRLTVRDSQIQGLLQKLPGLNNLERSSSPINRGRF
ncbi:MAG: LPS-assembly protein LptD [Balneolales bacterium]|nr:LPS-assembly protein LptD [Balneolales bacterium]